jgi:hypothetical protein
MDDSCCRWFWVFDLYMYVCMYVLDQVEDAVVMSSPGDPKSEGLRRGLLALERAAEQVW